MLYRFEFANVYSFADPQVIDLRIGAAVPDEPGRFAPLWPGSAERAPKVVALFGANASGKSNVLRAAAFLALFIADSFTFRPDLPMPVQRFLGALPQGPMRFAAEFAGPARLDGSLDNDAPACAYRYELGLDGGTNSPVRVVHEALLYRPPGALRRRRLFARDAEGQVVAAPEFGLAGLHTALRRILRSDAGVLSTCARLNHGLAAQLAQAARLVFRNIFLEQEEPDERAIAQFLAGSPEILQALNRDIERADLGVRGVEIVPWQNALIPRFRHEGLGQPIGPLFESHGTRRFFRLYPILAQVLRGGGIALIDELDQALHPALAAEVMRWFHDPERNPHNAQLWVTCQSPALLDELRKEEVFLCEKDPQGRSRVYGLRDIQGVRRDENLTRNYLGGVYGAVPHLG